MSDPLDKRSSEPAQRPLQVFLDLAGWGDSNEHSESFYDLSAAIIDHGAELASDALVSDLDISVYSDSSTSHLEHSRRLIESVQSLTTPWFVVADAPRGFNVYLWTLTESEDPLLWEECGMDEVIALILDMLDILAPEQASSTAHQPSGRLPLELEVFAHTWLALRNEYPITETVDVRTADALVRMLTEVVNNPDPPNGVIKATMRWFASKADAFTEAFATTAGKTAGAAAGLGIGATITGNLPRLSASIARVIDSISN